MAKQSRYAAFKADANKNQPSAKSKKSAKEKDKNPSFLKENWSWLKFFLLPPIFLLVGIVGILGYSSIGSFDWVDDVVDLVVPADTGPKNYAEKHVDECRDMTTRFSGTRGDRDPGDIGPLIGLEVDPSGREITKSCIGFARRVAVMETVSSHRHHTYLCPGTVFDIREKYAFMPSPDGTGVTLAGYKDVTKRSEQTSMKHYAIQPERMMIIRDWQFYNAGNGCLIVGHSGPFRDGFRTVE